MFHIFFCLIEGKVESSDSHSPCIVLHLAVKGFHPVRVIIIIVIIPASDIGYIGIIGCLFQHIFHADQIRVYGRI